MDKIELHMASENGKWVIKSRKLKVLSASEFEAHKAHKIEARMEDFKALEGGVSPLEIQEKNSMFSDEIKKLKFKNLFKSVGV